MSKEPINHEGVGKIFLGMQGGKPFRIKDNTPVEPDVSITSSVIIRPVEHDSSKPDINIALRAAYQGRLILAFFQKTWRTVRGESKIHGQEKD